MNKQLNSSANFDEEDFEIDFINISRVLWRSRKDIVKTFLVFLFFGVIISLTVKDQYTSSTVVKPMIVDQNNSISRSLGGFAAIAGINISGASNSAEIHPSLYPKIFESYQFLKEIMGINIYVEELDKEVSIENYYTNIYSPSILWYIKKYTIGLPGLIINSILKKPDIKPYNSGIEKMSESDYTIINILLDQIEIFVDELDGSVTISCTMPEKTQAAQVTKSIQNILQREVINYKLAKAKEDLLFTEERYIEKKIEFNLAQSNLAKYRDANKNINSAIALTEIQRLESEYELAFSIYLEISKQLEMQKIKVKENTPVFAILKKPVIQFKTSGNEKLIIIIIFSLFGFLFGAIKTSFT